MATLIALGGAELGEISPQGKLSAVSSDPIHREILAKTKKKHPKILYIPTAVDDSGDEIAVFRQYYLGLGASEVEVLRLLGKENPSQASIRRKILEADAVYVNGGNTFHMLQVWKRYGVDTLLKKAYQQGIVMSGYSAGSICWFSYGCSDSFYKHRPFRLKAMNWHPALICPHYDSQAFRRPALKKIIKRTPGLVGIGLDEDAAIEIVDPRYRILTSAPEAKVRRTYWKQGKYFIEELENSKEFKDLNTLLTKP